jgi:integrase
MFSLAVEWGFRTDNPAMGIKSFDEQKRTRWLTVEELGRLTKALRKHPNQASANAIRLMALTGARKGEVLHASWSEFDLEAGTWTKPSHHTKQKRQEHVPLNAAALDLLKLLKKKANGSDYLFLGPNQQSPLQDVKRTWKSVTIAAKLTGVRIHDLRHTFASHLVSDGLSLHIVGKLLGHTQAQTTARYAHLADQPLREATNRFAEIVNGR